MGARKPLRESELDKFRQWIAHLRLASKTRAVIVESEREKRRLAALGIMHLFPVSGKRLFEFAEKLATRWKECILLFDADARGRELYKETKKAFEEVGLKIDQRFEQFIYHTKLKTIEGIFTYVEKYLFSGLNPRKTVEL